MVQSRKVSIALRLVQFVLTAATAIVAGCSTGGYDFDAPFQRASTIWSAGISSILALYGLASVFYPTKIHWHFMLALDSGTIALMIASVTCAAIGAGQTWWGSNRTVMRWAIGTAGFGLIATVAATFYNVRTHNMAERTVLSAGLEEERQWVERTEPRISMPPRYESVSEAAVRAGSDDSNERSSIEKAPVSMRYPSSAAMSSPWSLTSGTLTHAPRDPSDPIPCWQA